jgi:hypothetical protein
MRARYNFYEKRSGSRQVAEAVFEEGGKGCKQASSRRLSRFIRTESKTVIK